MTTSQRDIKKVINDSSSRNAARRNAGQLALQELQPNQVKQLVEIALAQKRLHKVLIYLMNFCLYVFLFAVFRFYNEISSEMSRWSSAARGILLVISMGFFIVYTEILT